MACNLFNKMFRYRWTHVETGTTGEKTWTGLSRPQFLEDLAHWNSMGQQGCHHWTYAEI